MTTTNENAILREALEQRIAEWREHPSLMPAVDLIADLEAALAQSEGAGEEVMSVTLASDGTVTSHNSFDADFDDMLAATLRIISELERRVSNRKFCPFSHGSIGKHGTISVDPYCALTRLTVHAEQRKDDYPGGLAGITRDGRALLTTLSRSREGATDPVEGIAVRPMTPAECRDYLDRADERVRAAEATARRAALDGAANVADSTEAGPMWAKYPISPEVIGTLIATAIKALKDRSRAQLVAPPAAADQVAGRP